jgi:hypothetical protein
VSNIIPVIHCRLSIFKNSQESEMMPWVYPTKTSQNILLGILKPLQTDLVNIVWLINLTSLIPAILTVLVKYASKAKTFKLSKILRYRNHFGTLSIIIIQLKILVDKNH